MGRTTIVKHMQTVRQDGFKEHGLAEYLPMIYKSVDVHQENRLRVWNTRTGCVVTASTSLCALFKYCRLGRLSLRGCSNPNISYTLLPTEIAEAIHQPKKDPIHPGNHGQTLGRVLFNGLSRLVRSYVPVLIPVTDSYSIGSLWHKYELRVT